MIEFRKSYLYIFGFKVCFIIGSSKGYDESHFDPEDYKMKMNKNDDPLNVV